ncbi:hypothetical protein BpHYR1_015933 [Brachionus plicatilis]|uniref:Uncharacterized protein n=1 Tax=Brachionus plicatilis TaxID=10195 RepID=A0A3M7S613_BRAPC|nr:hypothetical protein BpHYR1_015933 [Brachionus plicatilis]
MWYRGLERHKNDKDILLGGKRKRDKTKKLPEDAVNSMLKFKLKNLKLRLKFLKGKEEGLFALKAYN